MTPSGHKCLSAKFVAAFCGLIVTGCQADCVRRCNLDPVEQDLKRWKAQREPLEGERRALMQRVREFEDKVFVNQKAALDLLKADLTKRCREFVVRMKAIKVRTGPVRRVHSRELKGFEQLARSYAMLQAAFETEDATATRRGLSIRSRALVLIRGAELARQKLERKYFRKKVSR